MAAGRRHGPVHLCDRAPRYSRHDTWRLECRCNSACNGTPPLRAQPLRPALARIRGRRARRKLGGRAAQHRLGHLRRQDTHARLQGIQTRRREARTRKRRQDPRRSHAPDQERPSYARYASLLRASLLAQVELASKAKKYFELDSSRETGDNRQPASPIRASWRLASHIMTIRTIRLRSTVSVHASMGRDISWSPYGFRICCGILYLQRHKRGNWDA